MINLLLQGIFMGVSFVIGEKVGGVIGELIYNIYVEKLSLSDIKKIILNNISEKMQKNMLKAVIKKKSGNAVSIETFNTNCSSTGNIEISASYIDDDIKVGQEIYI